jgi:hypothetical protein
MCWLVLDYCTKKGDRKARLAAVQTTALIWLNDLSSVRDIEASMPKIVKMVESPHEYIEDQEGLAFQRWWVNGMCLSLFVLDFLLPIMVTRRLEGTAVSLLCLFNNVANMPTHAEVRFLPAASIIVFETTRPFSSLLSNNWTTFVSPNVMAQKMLDPSADTFRLSPNGNPKSCRAVYMTIAFWRMLGRVPRWTLHCESLSLQLTSCSGI